MTYIPLVVGQLNDGIEPRFTGTDVPELAKYVQVIMGVELDRRLSDQLPGWTTIQGDVGSDNSDKGIAIAPNLMKVQGDPIWTPMAGKQAILTVHAIFNGSPLSMTAAHRPIDSQVEGRATFDAALGAFMKSERQAGWVNMVGIDTNDSNPTNLLAQCPDGTQWIRPYPVSICGILMARSIHVAGCVSLPKTGEHPPVISLVKVPVPA